MATPQLQQCYISSCNPAGVGGDTGDAFLKTLPNPVGAGNCIIIAASYPAAVTSATITDNNGNTWPAATITETGGTGNYKLSVFVLPNANAGPTQFELNIGATKRQPVAWEIYEYNNIATSSPVDVSHGAANQSGTSLAAGSMTTTAAGDLILTFAHPSGGIGGNPTGWTAGGSATLLAADIAWNSQQGYPKASQYQIQASAGAINPSISIAGDSADTFNVISVALKSASAGTAYTGMRLLKHIQQCCNALSGTTWKLQFPTMGNLRFMGSTMSDANQPISAISDSESNSWTNLSWNVDSCQGYFLENASANSALTMTLTLSAASTGNGVICGLFDIIGAATSGQPGASVSNSLTAISASATSAPNQPDITPQSGSGSILIGLMNNQGAGGGSTAGLTTGVTGPTGAVWAGTLYTGRTGGSQFDFGDGWATVTDNQSTSQLNFTYSVNTITGGNNVAGAAVEFLPAVAASNSGSVSGVATVTGKAASTGSVSGAATVTGQPPYSGSVSAAATVKGLAASIGSVSGIATVSSTSFSVGTVSGQAVATGLAASIGSVTGAATVNGVAPSSGSSGSVTGTATVSGLAASTGKISGIATVSGAGQASGLSTGTVSATATVSGLAASIGSVSGVATVSGVGKSKVLRTGTVSSAATVKGLAASTGKVSGVATVSGLPTGASIGTVSGAATVSGLAASLGKISGVAAVSGASQFETVGSVSGHATAKALAASIGKISGVATVSAIPNATGIGSVSGVATAKGLAASIGSVFGHATVQTGFGNAGSVSGLATVQGLAASTGAISGLSTLLATGLSRSTLAPISFYHDPGNAYSITNPTPSQRGYAVKQ